MSPPAPAELLKKIDAYWRAANYLSVGQIYLLVNPLLRLPLQLEHVIPIRVHRHNNYPFIHEKQLREIKAALSAAVFSSPVLT